MRWFRDLGLADIASVGGKHANLGKLVLASIGIDSISVTPDALAAVVKMLA